LTAGTIARRRYGRKPHRIVHKGVLQIDDNESRARGVEIGE
jgi:hypothetical protein